MSQRAAVLLASHGHKVEVELAGPPGAMADAVRAVDPDLVLCPFLTHRVPAEVWSRYRTVIIHPGPVGDRGPSSLDWAIAGDAPAWGVTALQAVEDFDAGPVWATREFALPGGGGLGGPRKSELYNGPVADLAMELIEEVAVKAADPEFAPVPVPPESGVVRPLMRQADRVFDWAADPAAIVRRIRAADGAPGVRTRLCGVELMAYDAHPGPASPEPRLLDAEYAEFADYADYARPGTVLARKHGAVLVRAGGGGSVWIGRAKAVPDDGGRGIKLPATDVLADQLARLAVPDHSSLFDPVASAPGAGGFQEIVYRRQGSLGRLTFDFYNGAMSTSQCRRLFLALRHAVEQDTAALVLEGGTVFSNGIDLNTIEAAANPALEAWENINAINDICREIITCAAQPLIVAVSGNAGAGGVMLGLGAHHVVVRSGVVLNPHYATMGLYGSEYWTYTLPRRTGRATAERLTRECQPIDAVEAVRLGLADAVGPADRGRFESWLLDQARRLAAEPARSQLLDAASARLEADERRKPLSAYRAEELAQMSQDMFADRNGFADARAAFVYKMAKRTPATA
ncbi:MAG TPA: enoyl-CoA hydratase-related protein [Actinocrinis sp.]|nr:enoyl-CoA hydratase-related protein [Actinocrinis sp.]